MKNKTLRFLSKVMCLVLVAAFALEAPMLSAFETIPVNVGGQTVQVTPGQWLSVRQGTKIVQYNVRYVDGKPVALEYSQYVKLIFGGEVGVTTTTPANAPSGNNSGSNANSGSAANSGATKPSTGSTGSNSGSTSGQTSQSVQSGQTTQNTQTGRTPQPRDPQTGRFIKADGSTTANTNANNGANTSANAPANTTSGNGTSASTNSNGNYGWDGGNGVYTPDGKPVNSNTSGQASGNTSGQTSGNTSGQTSGQTSGNTSGNTSGQTSGQVSGQTSGQTTTARPPQPRDPKTGRFIKASDATTTTTGTSGNTNAPSTTNVDMNGATSANSGGQISADTQQANAGSNSSTDSSWNAKHPRDPKTGRFIKASDANTAGAGISEELIGLPEGGTSADGSAQTGQNGQSGQSGQVPDGDPALPGQTGGDSAQGGQTGQNGQTTGDSAQSGQAGQAGKPGFKETVGNKFQSGYAAGKAMGQQGVQNVKDSLSSGFSAKNLLVTAGITVGVDLAQQIMKGEKPSVKKALKTVCSAEFAGSVVGGVTGAAAGSFFVPFLSAIPVVGGFLGALAPTFGSIVGSSAGAYLAGDLKNGRFSLKAAFKQIDWVGVAGQTVGSTVGAMLGSAIFPPFGTIIGGMVGGYLGNWAAHKIAGIFGKDKQQNGNSVVVGPVGTNPYDQGTFSGGTVTVGNGVNGGSQTAGDNSPELVIEGNTVGTYNSELDMAYSQYQELYQLYKALMDQGREDDAIKVAAQMNQAKAKYDELRNKAGK